MKGKAKLVRYGDGKYRVFVRNYFWQKWKLLKDNNDNEIMFRTFKEFGEVTKIECFDVITLTYNQFSGMERD